MDFVNTAWFMVVYFFLLFFLEYITTIVFNFKIIQISEKKWQKAAINGAIATFIRLTFSAFISFFSVESNLIWIIFASSFTVGFGTFLGTYHLKYIFKFFEKRKAKKDIKKQNS